MDIASKIRVVNSGPMAYNAAITRKEFKDILSEYESEISKLYDKIHELEHSNRNLKFKTDIIEKEYLNLKEAIKESKSKGFINFIKKLF